MSALAAAFRELIGLFVDDGWLAAAIIAVVALAALCAAVSIGPAAAGFVLLFGCLAVLVANVRATIRR